MQNSFIEKGSFIGKHLIIYPHIYIGAKVIINDYSIIHSNVHLENCHIGQYNIIHSGAIIGSAGFNYSNDIEQPTHTPT